MLPALILWMLATSTNVSVVVLILLTKKTPFPKKKKKKCLRRFLRPRLERKVRMGLPQPNCPASKAPAATYQWWCFPHEEGSDATAISPTRRRPHSYNNAAHRSTRPQFPRYPRLLCTCTSSPNILLQPMPRRRRRCQALRGPLRPLRTAVLRSPPLPTQQRAVEEVEEVAVAAVSLTDGMRRRKSIVSIFRCQSCPSAHRWRMEGDGGCRVITWPRRLSRNSREWLSLPLECFDILSLPSLASLPACPNRLLDPLRVSLWLQQSRSYQWSVCSTVDFPFRWRKKETKNKQTNKRNNN